ncbi:MAG: DUF433 domain-containing protein [Verrucomicrobiota bacterium]
MKSNLPLSYPPEVPIWVDPERLSGAPCFKGTRVPVNSLFTNLESGLSLDEYSIASLTSRVSRRWRCLSTPRS